MYAGFTRHCFGSLWNHLILRRSALGDFESSEFSKERWNPQMVIPTSLFFGLKVHPNWHDIRRLPTWQLSTHPSNHDLVGCNTHKEQNFIRCWGKLTCCVVYPFGVVPEQHFGSKRDVHCRKLFTKPELPRWFSAVKLGAIIDCGCMMLHCERQHFERKSRLQQVAPGTSYNICRTSRNANDFDESTYSIAVWCLYPKSLMALINSGELSVYTTWTSSFDPGTVCANLSTPKQLVPPWNPLLHSSWWWHGPLWCGRHTSQFLATLLASLWGHHSCSLAGSAKWVLREVCVLMLGTKILCLTASDVLLLVIVCD